MKKLVNVTFEENTCTCNLRFSTSDGSVSKRFLLPDASCSLKMTQTPGVTSRDTDKCLKEAAFVSVTKLQGVIMHIF